MKEPVALSGLRKADEAAYLKTVSMLLLRTVKLLNATNTLNAFQIQDLAMRITRKFYYFRLDEVVYVLDRGVSGDYGRDYNRIDAGVIMGWMDQYDTGERAFAVEALREQTYVETPNQPLNDEMLGAYYQRVRDGEKTIIPKTPRFNEDEVKKQAEARARYIAEKQAGVVQDIGWEEINEQQHEPAN